MSPELAEPDYQTRPDWNDKNDLFWTVMAFVFFPLLVLFLILSSWEERRR